MSRVNELNNILEGLSDVCNEELMNEDNLDLTGIELFLVALNKFTDSMFEHVEEDASVGSTVYGTVDLDKVMFLVGAGGLAIPIGGSNESNNDDGTGS